MNLVQRVQGILLKPKETWPVIDAESATVASIYKEYLLILAAIPVIASFIGMSLIGVGGFGISIRTPIVAGLVQAALTYGLSLLMVYVLSLIVDALAPSFGGTKNPLNAFKVVAFSMTASYVVGILSIVPMLGMLGILGALYGFYLLYLGLPVLMKSPEDKAIGYTAVVAVIGFVASIIIGVIASAVTAPFVLMGASSAISVDTPDGKLAIDTSKLEAMAKQMEEAGKKLEDAQASGDTAAAGAALGAMVSGGGTPIASQELKAFLPENIAGLKRNSVEAESNSAMGFSVSTAKAAYGDDTRSLRLSITDLGGAGGLMSLAAWANVTSDKETDTAIEKIYKDGQRTLREDYQKDGSRGQFSVVLANGVMLEAEGNQVDIALLKQAVVSVNPDKIEALQRPAKQ
ncbi:Yip1 family protein [Chitinimonas sp. JJ19]|uniref:Yip1 family protein n=1 Tax=Chitinimonas sp. JJ19 TaxID=3109352 RepID=UPI0030014CE9